MLAERKLSSKINYDVLRGLKSEDNSNYGDGDDLTTPATDELALKVEATPSSSLSTIAEVDDEEGGDNEMAVVYESGPSVSLTTSKRPGSKRG